MDNSTRKPASKGKKITFWLIFNPITALVLAAAILALIFLPAYNETLGAESVYDNVFVAALGDKYDRLVNTTEPKIAVIGGSSVAFGLDSELLSYYTGREVVNFGLYATLGSKVMLDISEDGLYEGDIVVFAPELDAQTMSMYFNAKSVWQAIDVNRDLLNAVSESDRGALWDGFSDFRKDKSEYLDEGTKPNPSGVYNRSNFNKYGDISYPRPNNTMGMGYDPNTLFSLSPSIISPDFLEYFNAYCARMQDKGVTVYFSFCPINDLALEEGVTDETVMALEEYLKSNLNCRVISSLDDYIMDYGYFFDTNLHLNDAGVVARTAQLIKDINAVLGNKDKITLDVPPPPAVEGAGAIGGDNTYLSYFEYTEVIIGGNLVGYAISGVTDEGRTSTETAITLPSSYEGMPIMQLKADVLSQLQSLTTLTVGAGMSAMDDGVFRGCASLTEVRLEFSPDNCAVTVLDQDNPYGLMLDAPEELKLNVYSDIYEDFTNHYTWGHYARYIIGEMER